MADCRKCSDFDWCLENEDCGLFKPKQMTNADLIRTMTDEELARWLETKVWDLPWCNDDIPVDDETKICSKWDCAKCALEWLKQEASK